MTERVRPTFDVRPKAKRDVPPSDSVISASHPVMPPATTVNPASCWNGEWAVEFAMIDGEFKIDVAMAGGVMKVRGDAVVRRGPKTSKVPITLVLRFEDAAELGLRLVGELRGSDRGA